MTRSPTIPFLGQGPAFAAFLSDLERAAQGPVTVLIQGESGSGKTSAAAHLHGSSPRAAGPLVTADLGALAPHLIEAQLFGHEEGAYTGADRARLGRFRAAEGGTLVLEGIEDLPLATQVKLLRVLQERVVEPLGAEVPVPVDVRVVATSTRPLLEAVEAGAFREDLYYRLAVVVLRVPPLRSRSEDLEALALSLVERTAARLSLEPRPLSPGALERLRGHPWPGNVRELENAIERVQVLAPGGRRTAPVVAAELAFLDEAVAGAAETLARQVLAMGLGLEELTGACLDQALREERGNASAAARRLGLSRRAFDYRKRKQAEAEESPESPEAAGGSDEPGAAADPGKE